MASTTLDYMETQMGENEKMQDEQILTPTDLFQWLVALTRICGDEVPTAQQWKRFVNMVEEVQAADVRRKLLDHAAEKQKADLNYQHMMYLQAMQQKLAAGAATPALPATPGYISRTATSGTGYPFGGTGGTTAMGIKTSLMGMLSGKK